MTDTAKAMVKRLLIAVVFSIAFAYVESAVVVYLRAIFHPNGFTFPLEAFDITPLGRRLLLTEIGREAATLVLILTAAWLFGNTRQERGAYVLITFAIWDIFYYVWLKVLLDWPTSLLDWDVLFLIPLLWASPVLYPVLVSLLLFAFGVAVLGRSVQNRPLTVTYADGLGWLVAALIVVVAFCIGGRHITKAEYADSFYWPLFAVGYALGLATCIRSLRRTSEPGPP